jgi:hypothetical protein
MYKLLVLVLTMVFLGSNIHSFGQSNEDIATINIYRLKESAMSGGNGLSVKIFFNDKEITLLQTNTKLSYKLSSTGNVKVKCVAEFGGSPIGSPFVETFDFVKGKEYHISISAGSMFGVKGEVADEGMLKKINKNKFADTISKVEEK